jgi:hypothetical protein
MNTWYTVLVKSEDEGTQICYFGKDPILTTRKDWAENMVTQLKECNPNEKYWVVKLVREL